MIYTGEIENGKMHGKGTLVYPNGEKYDGDWVHGKRHGIGTYEYSDSSTYEGEWVDDKVPLFFVEVLFSKRFKEKEHAITPMEINTLVIGLMEPSKAKEFYITAMVIDTKETG